jgi:hypothetical protein
MPSSQRLKKMTEMVQSIATPFSDRTFLPCGPGHGERKNPSSTYTATREIHSKGNNSVTQAKRHCLLGTRGGAGALTAIESTAHDLLKIKKIVERVYPGHPVCTRGDLLYHKYRLLRPTICWNSALSRVNDLSPHCVAHNLPHGVKFHLSHDVGAMRLGCFGADVQRGGNLFAGFSFRQ